jgi:HPt (histidine-containing phosphotransfer) domain-containing protein
MINWDRVVELRDEIGADGFAEVVGLFLAEADDCVARMPAAATPSQVEAEMHFLKGSALNLGLDELADLCQQGERAARGLGDTVAVHRLQDLYHRSRQALLDGLASRTAA